MTSKRLYKRSRNVMIAGEKPVNVSVRLTFPASRTTPPSNASYAIDWGDGTTSTKEPLPIVDGTDFSLDLYHEYPGTGDWNAVIKIWNLASSKTLTVSVSTWNMFLLVESNLIHKPVKLSCKKPNLNKLWPDTVFHISHSIKITLQ